MSKPTRRPPSGTFHVSPTQSSCSRSKTHHARHSRARSLRRDVGIVFFFCFPWTTVSQVIDCHPWLTVCTFYVVNPTPVLLTSVFPGSMFCFADWPPFSWSFSNLYCKQEASVTQTLGEDLSTRAFVKSCQSPYQPRSFISGSGRRSISLPNFLLSFTHFSHSFPQTGVSLFVVGSWSLWPFRVEKAGIALWE